MEKFFKLRERGTTVGKEVAGGVTTFLAMAYILALTPGMLSDAGMSWNAVFTATALSAAVATIVMAFAANLPVGLATGMGLNAFFAYSVVIGMGVSFQIALTAVFLEGIVFILLSLFGIREAIIRSLPESVKKAVAVGIGLFITIIGLANAGIVSGDTGTLIGFVNFSAANKAATVAMLGLAITVVLYVLKVPGAVLVGIIITTIIGIPFGITSIPENFRFLSTPAAPYWCAFDFKGISNNLGQFFIIFFTFLFTDMFDTIGTLLGVAEQANLKDADGNVKNAKGALLSDAIGTVVGACLGASTVTSFVESSSGVAAGARTGLASLVTGILFLLSIFLSPIFFLIPAAATAPALIFVGYLMMQSVVGIKFSDPSEGIPAFIIIMTMPFSYSIAKGIVFGVIAYVLCKVFSRKSKEIPFVTWILAAIFFANIVFEAMR